MDDAETHVVTGAFGFSGQYIARRLLRAGIRVHTLTNSPQRHHVVEGEIAVSPYHFDDPAALTASLRGADVLYNTYWVRFNARHFSHEEAVTNTLTLFTAAKDAGISRIVHVSITNPALDSPLEYFRGKAVLERALLESGLSYAILRPAVLFGEEDILINNIAWSLRHLPLFGMFGDGGYRLQPIYVDDFAALAVAQGRTRENAVIEAIGPETYTYKALVQMLCRSLGISRPILALPPMLGYLFTSALGWIMRDHIVTREEIEGLMADLLYVDAPPAGTTKLSEWASAHAATLGRHYANEMARRANRLRAYKSEV